MANKWENNEEIKTLREYLQIPSVHPNIDYEPCVNFLRKQAESLELPCNVYRLFNEKAPIIVISWIGTSPELPSIMLNSHMDVVPAYAEYWSHPPFGAEIDENGNIYARGAQDMKSMGTQYLAAIRALKKAGQTLKRTLHVVYVPDEETDAKFGWKQFVDHDVFKSLNVSMALDEGSCNENDVYRIFYAERSNWKTVFKCTGKTGHGSVLFKDTAGEKLSYITQKLYAFREVEVAKLESNPSLEEGDVTSVNLTICTGGVQYNLIPPVFTATFDIRINPDLDLKAFEKQLRDWCQEAGGGIEIEFLIKDDNTSNSITHLNDDNIYWVELKKALEEDLKVKFKPTVMSGNTDMWYVRLANIPAIGISPIINTPNREHENDEFIPAEQYMKGIDIYTKILLRIANIP